jgi:ribosome-associated protein
MNTETIINEFEFKAIRSSGPGGQHVNKTSSKIVLSFHVHNSNGLEEKQKDTIDFFAMANKSSICTAISVLIPEGKSVDDTCSVVEFIVKQAMDGLRNAFKNGKKKLTEDEALCLVFPKIYKAYNLKKITRKDVEEIIRLHKDNGR